MDYKILECPLGIQTWIFSIFNYFVFLHFYVFLIKKYFFRIFGENFNYLAQKIVIGIGKEWDTIVSSDYTFQTLASVKVCKFGQYKPGESFSIWPDMICRGISPAGEL